MIVFVSNYPNKENLRDGMMQRVAAIDSLVKDKKRIYLDISFKRNFKRTTEVNDKCTVEHINFFLHFFSIYLFLSQSKTIYIHSIYNLLKIYIFFKPNKSILDIHGVVPEEVQYVKKNILAKIYNIIECTAIKKCFRLVHVTKAMQDHYRIKYNINLESRSIILPIFESLGVEKNSAKWKENIYQVVYAGGMQAWQNVDLMTKTVVDMQFTQRRVPFVFNFFFPENQLSTFSTQYTTVKGIKQLKLGSLPKNEIISFLEKSHMGFVLREDILVNRVACPTKLIEYLECGVVPIVFSPEIGDFNTLGYKYIKLDDFIKKEYSADYLAEKAEHNFVVLQQYKNKAHESKLVLSALFE